MEPLGKGDIEGKAAMVAASELESERVSNKRERMSQSFRSLDTTRFSSIFSLERKSVRGWLLKQLLRILSG